jgi:hypothetical protein
MLIKIGENSASLTSFGSLASAGRGSDGSPSARTVINRPRVMRLALQLIWLRCVALKRARPVLLTKSRLAP